MQIDEACAYLRWKKKEKVVPFFIHLVRGLTSLRKVETEFTDFVDAMDIQEGARAWASFLGAAEHFMQQSPREFKRSICIFHSLP